MLKFYIATIFRCLISGWGKWRGGRYNVKIQKEKVTILSKEECESAIRISYRLSRQEDKAENFKLHSSELCAFGGVVKDANGAPLVCEIEEDRWEIVGIFSSNSVNSSIALYTNLYDMVDFITSKT